MKSQLRQGPRRAKILSPICYHRLGKSAHAKVPLASSSEVLSCRFVVEHCGVQHFVIVNSKVPCLVVLDTASETWLLGATNVILICSQGPCKKQVLYHVSQHFSNCDALLNCQGIVFKCTFWFHVARGLQFKQAPRWGRWGWRWVSLSE